MKYEIGQKLEYTGTNNYIIEIIGYNQDGEYKCEVCEGSQDRVGLVWYKQSWYLDENYKVIKKEPYIEQKNKLVL